MSARGCDSCEMLSINGVSCHETGCRRTPLRCLWCGVSFASDDENRDRRCCSHSCAVAYSNRDCDCEECFGVSLEEVQS
jgi:hypothetical protein